MPYSYNENANAEVLPRQLAENQLFPVFVKLNKLRTLLVGAGKVGTEKLSAIVENCPEAKITVVALEFSDVMRKLAANYPTVQLQEKSFEPKDLDRVDIVFSATNNPTLNEQLVEECHQKGLLINVADKPDLCDFYLGSIVRKGDLKIAISTNGKSPTMAKRLKEIMDGGLPDELNLSLQHLHSLRQTLNGDFEKKVSELNKVTASLIYPKKSFLERNIKWLIWSVAVLFLFAVGITLWDTEPAFRSFLTDIDSFFYWFFVAGFVFAMIDGAIGMSYGVTSASFSLAMGLSPATASMGIHISEVLSNGIAGWMHYKMGNINWKLFRILIVPAIVGAILGAFLLSSAEEYSHYVKPIIGLYTFFLGAVIFLKALNLKRKRGQKKIRRIGILGFFGGFIDAAFGGGWGSIVLSNLIAGGRHPLFSLGTVKISRFFIATLSSLTFFLMLGTKHWEAVLGLVLGSALAAPIAAKVSNKISAKTIMLLVAIIVMITSLRNIFLLINNL